jgi:pimeloyl-ACP methyl ester carboxylesterase
VIATLNGLLGDRLEQSNSDLHQPRSVRVDGVPVALDSGSLSAAFPDATARVVVFLHGLMGTEFYWDLGARHPGDTYGARLASDLNLTPVYLRYNAGLHISENGQSVAALLEQLAQAWPVEVREIALVGHSMGGWSRVAPATRDQKTASAGPSACVISSRWAPLTSARRWRKGHTWPPRRSTRCPRRG